MISKTNASKIISFIFVFCIVLSSLLCTASAKTNTFDASNASMSCPDVEFIDTMDKYELDNLIEECDFNMEISHSMAENARSLGYKEDSVIIRMAQHNWWLNHDIKARYLIRLNSIKEKELEKYNDYPVAYQVWAQLKEYGYNDYVCAGIIGNMMVECGDQTLDLDYTAYGSGGYYYGLCQWNRDYYYDVFECSVSEQVEYLLSTIKYEFDVFGYAYRSGFDYDDFITLQDEQEVAEAFARCYERCGYGYSMRMNCATTAYNYFA